ncbi:Alpha/beta hydrolase fold-1 [Dillenia turbinata]|uniref:Alpha/beta hydrolase fold-1 n=1 Tax=Dillenia turbinata TaxID=194707 RepID=A0AAN8V1Y0_9MAGN
MAGCISFTATRDWCLRFTFTRTGLKSTSTDLGDGTVIHCWIPKSHRPSKPSLLLIHGFGANAMWQFYEFISPLASKFNLYIPDLVFFGDSYTSRPDRSETFQADCVKKLMDFHGVSRTNVVGISYGGFVSYRLAAQYPEMVERAVLICAGVCLEEKDMEEGLFQVKTIEEAQSILLPQTPDKMRELMRITFYKPATIAPSCFLSDFIDFRVAYLLRTCEGYFSFGSYALYTVHEGQVMCTEYVEERKQLIHTLHKDRRLSDLPKITQPTLILWGEHDRVFPLELAHRLQRHVGDNAQLVIIKDAGHALNAEKPKELYKYIKSFLINSVPPKPANNGNSKVD